MKRVVALGSVLLGMLLAACAGSDAPGEDNEDGASVVDEETPETSEAMLSESERDAICNAIPRPRPWTQDEANRLLAEVGRRASEAKRANDRLIDERGVGGYVGAGTKLGAAIGSGDLTLAAKIVKDSGKLKPGADANRIVKEMKGTSCIGWVYRTLDAVYTDLGRKDEWAAIEKCGRAWQSGGLQVQAALIKAGWSNPTLGFVTDENKLPGNAADVSLHKTFLSEVSRNGRYFGTPVSKTVMMRNFFPTPGSSTRADESVFLEVGHMNTIGFATVRGAYHVPLVVPASVVPADLAPAGSAGNAWRAAKERGEPFVLESHLRRDAWDKTNFEIRPLKTVIAETFNSSATYATGTIQFAPLGGGDILR